MSKELEKSNKILLFEGDEIRRVYFDDDWCYSVVDVIKVLTDSSNPRRYWSDLKTKLSGEDGAKLYDIIVQLKIKSNDGKRYETDCSDTEGILRIIQSIPSKKAEPFKRWLARVGKERLDEIEQPARAIERAKYYYLAKGYTPEWVQTRIAGIDTRHTFTDSLKESGIKESYHYAILTDELYKSSFGLSTREYKKQKRLSKKDSLRDNMTPLELASTIFSEAMSTELISETNPTGFVETRNAIHIAGNFTKEAIEKLEKATGKNVVTHKNMKELDSPEIRKELVQQASPKQIEENPDLSDFNKKLKTALDHNPKNKSDKG